MTGKWLRANILAAFALGLLEVVGTGISSTCYAWEDSKAQPRVISPGAKPGDPPADAVILLVGKVASGWRKENGRFAAWTAKNGELLCKPGSGSIVSTKKFDDAQIHLEFATPNMPKATGQGRGN